MISFFRNLRKRLLSERKVSKYLLYATGEILLVVIGILIALQINNWNDKQNQVTKERELLISVLENIKADSISIDSVIAGTNQILKVHDDLIQLSQQKISVNEVGNIDLIRKSEPNQLITKINNPNLPNELLDLELKKVILEYYLSIQYLEKGRSDNNTIIEQYIRPLLAEKKLLNFYAAFSTLKGDLNLIKEEEFFEEFKEEELRQYLFESRIKLTVLKLNAEKAADKNNETKEAIQKYIIK